MPSKLIAVWSLILSLALPGCALTGKAVSPPVTCPQPPKPPPALMPPPSYESKVRQLLFDSEPNATPRSEDSKPTP